AFRVARTGGPVQLEEGVDQVTGGRPGGDVAPVDGATGVGDPVVLAAAALTLVTPVRLDEAVLGEAAVRRVEGRLLDLVAPAGGVPDPFEDLKAVPVVTAQHGQHDRLGVAAQEVGREHVDLRRGIAPDVLNHERYYIRYSTSRGTPIDRHGHERAGVAATRSAPSPTSGLALRIEPPVRPHAGRVRRGGERG